MNAAVYSSLHPQGIFVTERPKPVPTKGHVLVQVKAAGVNPVDAKFVWSDKLPEAVSSLAKWFVQGRIAGFDFAGVVKWAPAHSGFKLHDLVFGCAPPLVGTFCEYVSVPLHQVASKPTSLSFVEAASLGIPGLTCVQVFSQHNLQAGQHLLVIGASGGVGHLATCIASLMGATVCGVCSGRNETYVKSLGATSVVDYNKGDIMVALRAKTLEHGRFNMVLDTVTSHEFRDSMYQYESKICDAEPPLLHDSYNYVRIGGQTCSWVAAGIKRILGISLFSKGHDHFWVRFPHCASDLHTLGQLADEHNLRPTIDVVVPLSSEGVQEAFQKLNSRHTRGKIVILVDHENRS